MPFFGEERTPYDEIIEKATNETNTSENWSLILEICDRVGRDGTKGAKGALLSLKKRLNHRDPHVVMLALSVLDSCMGNCGLIFQRELCTREFIAELKSKAVTSNAKIAERTRLLIKKWSEDECKSDPSLGLVPSLYNELKRDGYKFESSDPPKRSQKLPTDPNYVSSKEEEDAIAKAIQASLKDQEHQPSARAQPTKSLYPSGSALQGTGSQMRTVRALYDFEAAEDNELTFKAGETISLLDDSDINWWRGSNQRGEGLFPASFVTTDLNAPVIDLNATETKKKSVQFDENVDVLEIARTEVEKVKEPPRIDEAVLNRCLETLRDADPTGEHPDPPELAQLEDQSRSQVPLIDAELAEIDRQHNLLAEVDVKLRDALALYDSAMQEASAHFQAQMAAAMQHQPQMQYQPQMYAQPPVTGATYATPGQQMAPIQQQTHQIDMSQQQQMTSIAPGMAVQQQQTPMMSNQPQSFVNYGQ